MTSLPRVPSLSADVAARLSAALRAASFTPSGLRSLWGVDADSALEANDPAPARRACARRLAAGSDATAGRAREHSHAAEAASPGSAALAALALVFVLDQPVRRRHLVAALAEGLADDLETAGLLAPVAAEAGAGRGADGGSTGRVGAAPVTAPSAEDRLLRSVLALTCHALPVGVPRHQRPGDETLLLAADHGTLTTAHPLDGDYVLGYGGAGRTLAEITPREQVGLAADIGSGCGIQAVLLARHAETVIATDVSRRALACTALTAALNGVADAIEVREGSLYDPLTETVDLLVSNPPFVITPRGGAAAAEDAGAASAVFEYRDGGRTGDGIMREILTGAPARLNPDGQAVFLGNWEYGEGRTLPHEWLGPPLSGNARGAASAVNPPAASGDAVPEAHSGEDVAAGELTSAMVVERQRMSPAEYARTWIRDGGVARASRRWQADTEAWLDDFEVRGVERVGFGWVRLHRHADDAAGGRVADREAADGLGPDQGAAGREPQSSAVVRSFTHVDSGPGSNPAGLAAFLDLRLGMLEWLAAADDAELQATAFVLAGDVTEHRHMRPGAEDPSMLTLEQGAGLARTFQADPALAGFLGVCDGSLTLGQTAAALAQLLGADVRDLTDQLTRQVRALAPEGVLHPA